MNDISQDWKGSSARERQAIDEILRHEATPIAILVFDMHKHRLSHYWYWFVLSTLWVSYSGWSDLNLWRRLFKGNRPRRKTSIMKPSELRVYHKLPDRITAYRAHRPNETDWISYTTDEQLAHRWARQRGGYVYCYELRKSDCIAYLLRRDEKELLMLDPSKAKRLEGDGI